MDRRRFLALVGAGSTAALAGCQSEGGGDPAETETQSTPATVDSTATPTETETPTVTETESSTPTPEPASFVVTSTPDRRTEPSEGAFTVEFTVRNEGGQAGRYRSAVYRTQGGGDRSFVRDINTYLERGASHTFQLEVDAPNDNGLYFYSLEGTDASWVVEFQEPASFRVAEFSAPKEVEIGETFELTAAIRNTGAFAGTYESEISAREGSNDLQPVETLRAEIDGSDSITRTYEFGPFPFMTTVALRLEEPAAAEQIDIVSATLDFGESYDTPDGLELTARSPEFQSQYSWTSNGYEYVEEAPEGYNWAFVEFRGENNAGSPTYLPPRTEIALLADNRQYDARVYGGNRREYRGGEVQAGVVREGIILYQVPEGVDENEYAVAWSDEYTEGSVAIRWN